MKCSPNKWNEHVTNEMKWNAAPQKKWAPVIRFARQKENAFRIGPLEKGPHELRSYALHEWLLKRPILESMGPYLLINKNTVLGSIPLGVRALWETFLRAKLDAQVTYIAGLWTEY